MTDSTYLLDASKYDYDYTWRIQVKASMKSPHIKSEQIKRLKRHTPSINGIPVFATVQPWQSESDQDGASLGS